MLICGEAQSITTSSFHYGKTLKELRKVRKQSAPGSRTFDEHLTGYISFLRRDEEKGFREWLDKNTNTVNLNDFRGSLKRCVPNSLTNQVCPNDVLKKCVIICKEGSTTKASKCLKDGDDYYFHALLQLRHDWFKQTLRCHIEIEHVNNPAAVHFWLSDKREACFMFTDTGENRGRGFLTRDPALAEQVFDSMFTERWPKKPNPPPASPPVAEATTSPAEA